MKILVVDDDAPIRGVCERALSHASHDVRVAESGEAAVPLLSEDWDVIITDLAMPGSVNGIELLRQVRAKTSADVILMTGFPELNTAIEAMRGGAYDYLVKPFTPSILLMTVARCSDKRRLSRELAEEKLLRAEIQRSHQVLLQMEKVKETFGQFATPEVADFVLSHPQDYWKRGERKSVTVLFSDVRGFTPFAMSAEPEAAVDALNGIFSCVMEAVQKEGGILNKFIGDGLLALFGAPVAKGNHAAAAARAALSARTAVQAWAQKRSAARLAPLKIGIGVNTGEVIAGCIGTQVRTEYSVIGHSVNLASRLEEAALPDQILLGPGTVDLLEGAFKLGPGVRMNLAGISESVLATELLA
jgi:class 3 adenylate cyclase